MKFVCMQQNTCNDCFIPTISFKYRVRPRICIVCLSENRLVLYVAPVYILYTGYRCPMRGSILERFRANQKGFPGRKSSNEVCLSMKTYIVPGHKIYPLYMYISIQYLTKVFVCGCFSVYLHREKRLGKLD